jgi:trehalose 2-sulfotransferase
VPTSGYVICATPRTGSTYLCQLLSSTGMLGHPESYFREVDEGWWCAELSVEAHNGHALDYPDFARAVRTHASTPNGVFGVRIMWDSLEPTIQRLRQSPQQADLDVLDHHLGKASFVFLRRDDLAEQAVSWCKAEQTQFWQVGDVPTGTPTLDLDQLSGHVEAIQTRNRAWAEWFAAHGVVPLEISYDDVIRDSRAVAEAIAASVGIRLPADLQPFASSPKLADGVSRQWVDALRHHREHPRTPT